MVETMRYLAPMSFLYPSFLWALGALSIPILIHLFNFRKTTRVLFSSTRFLKHVKEITVARRKLKHYLILAARLLFLFFLVMAFAQPLIPASEQLGNNHNMVIYIDNSQSMSAQAGEKTRGLDAAINMASSIIETFPPDAHYKLITNDFAPFSNSFKSKGETLDLLTQLRLSPVSRTFAEVKDRINQDGTKAREIFWISDLQKSTLGTLPTSWDSTARLHLVPISFNKSANVFVDSAWLQNPFAAGGEKNVLTVKMQNDGETDVEQLNLKLTINGIQSAATSVNIPKKGFREANFDLTTGLSGLNEGKITFNDFPVSFDNDFYLSLNFTDKINILEIKNSAQVTAIQRVFGNKEVFNYQGFPETNFNYSLLETADLVVVNGLQRIDQSLGAALRSYLGKYGVILVVPSVNPDIDSYQRFAGFGMQVQKDGVPEDIDKPDFNDPFFENVFEERSVALAMPKATPYVRWGGDRSALLRFKNDLPFLSSFDQGGKLFMLASPLQQELHRFSESCFVCARDVSPGSKWSQRCQTTLLHPERELHWI